MEAMWNEEKERGLTEFSERSDREEALYFVGRPDLIAGIEKTVGQMWRLVAGKEVSDLVSSGLNLSDRPPGWCGMQIKCSIQHLFAEHMNRTKYTTQNRAVIF